MITFGKMSKILRLGVKGCLPNKASNTLKERL
jgi:hypothetical protein